MDQLKTHYVQYEKHKCFNPKANNHVNLHRLETNWLSCKPAEEDLSSQSG